MSIIRRMIFKIRGEMDIEKLKKKGLIIGEETFINFGCVIDESFCHLVEIGNRVVFAPRVHILAHDASTKKSIGYTKIGCVTIGDDVFVGAGTIILPNIRIGNKVVVGAGSVVTSDIPDNSVVVGVPAKIISSYDEYMSKEKNRMSNLPVYKINYTVNGGVTDDMKRSMKNELLKARGGFII